MTEKLTRDNLLESVVQVECLTDRGRRFDESIFIGDIVRVVLQTIPSIVVWILVGVNPIKTELQICVINSAQLNGLTVKELNFDLINHEILVSIMSIESLCDERLVTTLFYRVHASSDIKLIGTKLIVKWI